MYVYIGMDECMYLNITYLLKKLNISYFTNKLFYLIIKNHNLPKKRFCYMLSTAANLQVVSCNLLLFEEEKVS
jgi:hypothetical protein